MRTYGLHSSETFCRGPGFDSLICFESYGPYTDPSFAYSSSYHYRPFLVLVVSFSFASSVFSATKFMIVVLFLLFFIDFLLLLLLFLWFHHVFVVMHRLLIVIFFLLVFLFLKLLNIIS